MTQFLNVIVLTLFAASTLALAVYGIHLYVLVWMFRRRSKDARRNQQETIRRFRDTAKPEEWPAVTSQIPLYNEMDVAARIIRSIAALEYPHGKHEIQVLDDSDDESRDVVDALAAELRGEGLDITVLRRAERTGYKAGALAMGAEMARGEFIAIFDADFVPPEDFLLRAIPLLLESPDLACLQGRWAHLNQDESWLTRSQALGIDGHFAIEQGARAWNGMLMNFNGTAGVWRKAALHDPAVGGWSGDTLTEDLDLSYRAQLAGWRIDYCFDLACPAELPGDIGAFKSQQRRWATGSIQVAVKLLPRIWRSELTLGQRVEATLHLTHYSVAFWMLILAVVARPMLALRIEGGLELSRWIWGLWIIIFFSAVAPSITYSYARWSLGGGLSAIRLIPQMISLGCGMCINNALAVVRGLHLSGGEFVRTPKSGNKQKRRRASSYAPVQSNMWIAELALGVYSLVTYVYYMRGELWPVSIFLLLYGVGFLTVGWMSAPRRAAKQQDSSSVRDDVERPVAIGPSPAALAESART